MLSAISLMSIASGAALAQAANRLPPRAELLEFCAGALLIAGLGLIGAALPCLL
jgi:hypothetical protein